MLKVKNGSERLSGAEPYPSGAFLCAAAVAAVVQAALDVLRL